MNEYAYEGDAFMLDLDGDGIVHMRFPPHATLDVTDIREFADALERLAGGESPPLMVHMKNLESADREARAVGATLDIPSATALVTGPGIGRAIGNFYMAISKPQVPTRMFATEEEARSWLMKQRT